jgi:Domain of unknown function (DUF4129)
MVASESGEGGGVDAGERRGRGHRWPQALSLAALVAVLAGLLWLVALASHDRSPPPPGQSRGPLVASPRLVGAIYLLLLILGTVQLTLLVLQTMRRRLREPARRRSPWRGLRIMAVLVLLCFLLAYLALPDWLSLRPGSGQDEQNPADAASAAGGAAGGRSAAALGLEVAVFVAVLVVLAVALAARRRRRATPQRGLVAEELSALVERSLAELEAERDPRRAVIAAYAGMEQTLAANGLPRAPAEAPLEYLARALAELRVSEASAGRLTELFQRARFSRHEVGEAMKQDAIEALAAVRDELRGAVVTAGEHG